MASYGLKTVSRTLHVPVRTLLSFSCNNCVGVERIVRPHLARTRVVQAVMN